MLEIHAEAITSNDVFTARVRIVGGYKVKRGRGQRRNRRHAHGPVSGLRFGFGRFVFPPGDDSTQHACFPR